MTESMSCLKLSMKILAAICVIIFIITLPFGLLAFFSSNMIFNPEELSTTLTESLIDSGVLRSNIKEMLSEMEFENESGNITEALQDLSDEEWDHLLNILMPDTWLEKQIKNAVQALHTWLDDERIAPGIKIDLNPIKARIQGEGMLEIVELIIDSWPACTQEQVDQIQRSMMESGQAELQYCEPPEPIRSELVDFATQSFQNIFREIPPTISPFKTDQIDRNPDEVLLLKERIRTIRAFTMGGWLLSAALLGLIMILAIRSWRDVAIWWGLPILIAGVLTVLLGFSTGAAINRLWNQASTDIRLESGVLADMLTIPLSAIRDRVSGEVLGAGVIISIIGIGIIVIALLFHRAVRSTVISPQQNAIPPTNSGQSAPKLSDQASTLRVPPATGSDDSERPSGMFG